MKYIQEITEWNASWMPNHTYYVRDDRRKMVGYIKAGTKTLIKFAQPLPFDSRGRKFVVLKTRAEQDSVYFAAEPAQKAPENTVAVLGSNGQQYMLSKVHGKWTCSCPGYSFRRKCKHSDAKQD